MEFDLDGRQRRHRIAHDLTIVTTNVRGSLRTVDPEGSGARGFEVGGGDGFDETLKRAGLAPVHTVHFLPEAPRDMGGDATAKRKGRAAAATPPEPLLVEVKVERDAAALVLVEEPGGAVRWQRPEARRRRGRATRGAKGRKTRARDFGEGNGAGETLVFRIPVADTAGRKAKTRADGEGSRAFGGVKKKILKVFVYPITDKIFGPIGKGFARKWEKTHRPAFVRSLTSENYQDDRPDFPHLSQTEWKRLEGGRALLFVHGTFSTSGAFRKIERSVIEELARRYDGRLFAFNHPTLSEDPTENAQSFLSEVRRNGARLEVDIVCHSRGGLVARQIATLGPAAGCSVRKIVFVGAPNAGTPLTDADHMVDMLDRYTNLTKLIPNGIASTIVNSLVTALKVVAHGALNDLPGLDAMDPTGRFLKDINRLGGSAPELYAIASNYEPKAGSPFLSFTRLKDATMDDVFEKVPNDLVVPFEGVYEVASTTGFPIPADRCFKFEPDPSREGVVHTEYFADAATQQRLLDWLNPLATSADRAFAADGIDTTMLAAALDSYRDLVLATVSSRQGSRSLSRLDGFELSPGVLEMLRRHVLNLSEGTFRPTGIYASRPEDVERIFDNHLPTWARSLPRNAPQRIVFFAHGGLTGEKDGLQIARRHVDWWLKNGIYPIHFVWETGLLDALRSIAESIVRHIPGLGARGFLDNKWDHLIEEGARALGGVKVWGAMKQNAALCSAPNGGATLMAKRLASYCAAAGKGVVELHAVGHSAGAIFHSWFIPVVLRELAKAGASPKAPKGVPGFKSLHLLAPAIRVDEFMARLAPVLGAGKGIEKTTMFTMSRTFEERDACFKLYRKSLLYLIHHALEPEDQTDIVGLQMSLEASRDLAALFGLGASNAPGEIVYAVTEATSGDSASRSTTHGGFDDDGTTMDSVAARINGEPKARAAYLGDESRALRLEEPSRDWMRGFDLSGVTALLPSASVFPALSPPAGPPTRASASVVAASIPASLPASGGMRRALCVGINAYRDPYTLSGCVPDADRWSAVLQGLGFEIDVLKDAQATRKEIMERLTKIVRGSRAGDAIVFQYSGHGYQLPDLDGDEDEDLDEALVPIDYDLGGFLIDDDLRSILSDLPGGVSLTCFLDCCHSGTATRFMMTRRPEDGNAKTRNLQVPPRVRASLELAHRNFRANLRAEMGDGGQRGFLAKSQSPISWVNFSACRPEEKAYEHDNQGDFTRIATQILTQGSYDVAGFREAVIKAFGAGRRQTPQLDCGPGFDRYALFTLTARQ
jgi:pimeloyl-ACP methyl ester carboxylesterase